MPSSSYLGYWDCVFWSGALEEESAFDSDIMLRVNIEVQETLKGKVAEVAMLNFEG
jgi:hypothetical protein